MTSFEVKDNDKMLQDLARTQLMGKGFLLRVKPKDEMEVPVFPFEDGDEHRLFRAAMFATRYAVIQEADMYIFKEYMSYLVLRHGDWAWAIPMEENVDLLTAIVATGKVGIIRKRSDAFTKAGRRKYMKVFRIPDKLKKELYQGYLLFKDKLSRDYTEKMKERREQA